MFSSGKNLTKFIVIAGLMVILVHSLMSFNYEIYGWNLCAEEKESLKDFEKALKWKNNNENFITLKLLDYYSLNKAKVLINGKVIDNFDEKYLSIPVGPGDTVKIDGSFYEYPFKIKVVEISSDVVLSNSREVITCSGNIILLGEVISKNKNEGRDDNGSL